MKNVTQDELVDLLTNKILRNVRPKHNKKLYKFITKIAGYAGTGKTTLLCKLRKKIKNQIPTSISVAFISYTGKASNVLKSKLLEQNSLFDEDYVGTIHGLIYRPETVFDKKLNAHIIVGWKKVDSDEITCDILFIDEGSMVSKNIWNDLNSLEIPIIVTGDNAQLPPVSEDTFSLMKNPDYLLTENFRSSSPIIKLSTFVRKYGYIPTNHESRSILKLSWSHKNTRERAREIWNSLPAGKNIITLCGFNSSRVKLNDMARKKFEYNTEIPIPGERIICLMNNHNIKLMNGQIGTIVWATPVDSISSKITLEVDGEENYYECLMYLKAGFGEVTYTVYDKEKERRDKLYRDKKIKIAKKIYSEKYEMCYFDFGYATSVHKAQGSEWNFIVLFEQRGSVWDNEYYRRWLYTAVTRAKEKIVIFTDFY